MANPTLYRLHLRRPLSYSAESSTDTDTLLLFSDEALVLRDSETGPSITRPLPEPLFSGCVWLAPPQDCHAESGRQAAPKSAEMTATGRAATSIGPGAATAPATGPRPAAQAAMNYYVLAVKDYVFSQWRQSDFATLEEGLENFVRQVWWEQRNCEGPWILRRIREDGGVAFQGLRAVSDPD